MGANTIYLGYCIATKVTPPPNYIPARLESTYKFYQLSRQTMFQQMILEMYKVLL